MLHLATTFTTPYLTHPTPHLHTMSNLFSSPFGDNSNPFGGNRSGNMMHSVIEENENDPAAPPANDNFAAQSSGSLFSGPFGGGGDASNDAPSHPRTSANPDGYPAQYNFARRTSVSAESLKPSADTYDNWSPPVHEKTPEQISRLTHAIEGNFLFNHLEDEQSAQILGALVEKPIPAKGIKVCRLARGTNAAGTCSHDNR